MGLRFLQLGVKTYAVWLEPMSLELLQESMMGYENSAVVAAEFFYGDFFFSNETLFGQRRYI